MAFASIVLAALAPRARTGFPAAKAASTMPCKTKITKHATGDLRMTCRNAPPRQVGATLVVAPGNQGAPRILNGYRK